MRVAADAVAALNRDGIDAFLEHFDPNVEWVTPPNWLEDRVPTGHDGVRTAVAQFGEQLDEFRIDLDRIIDVDQRASSRSCISVGVSVAPATSWSSRSA